MATTRKGYGQSGEAFTPQEVADLLADIMRDDRPGYRAMKIIKWANKYNLGKHYDISIGRWEFSRQDVDTLRRLIEADLDCIYSTKDVEKLTGWSVSNIRQRAKRMGLGRQIVDALKGDPLMFTAQEVEQLMTFVSRKGDFMRDNYRVDDPNVLTVPRIAEMLKSDFPNLTVPSIEDKIRRAANAGVAGKHDAKKNMWLFQADEVDAIRRSMQTPRKPGRGGRPKKVAPKTIRQ